MCPALFLLASCTSGFVYATINKIKTSLLTCRETPSIMSLYKCSLFCFLMCSVSWIIVWIMLDFGQPFQTSYKSFLLHCYCLQISFYSGDYKKKWHCATLAHFQFLVPILHAIFLSYTVGTMNIILWIRSWFCCLRFVVKLTGHDERVLRFKRNKKSPWWLSGYNDHLR